MMARADPIERELEFWGLDGITGLCVSYSRGLGIGSTHWTMCKLQSQRFPGIELADSQKFVLPCVIQDYNP